MRKYWRKEMRNILEVLLVLIMLAFALYVSHGELEPCLSMVQGCWVHHVQRPAKVDLPGCVNAAGKLGQNDKLRQ